MSSGKLRETIIEVSTFSNILNTQQSLTRFDGFGDLQTIRDWVITMHSSRNVENTKTVTDSQNWSLLKLLLKIIYESITVKTVFYHF